MTRKGERQYPGTMPIWEAKQITGGLSYPTKMPGSSFSLSAKLCITGSKLARIPGTVCAGCYALRDHYMMPNVQLAHSRRHAGLSDPRWIEAMTRLLLHYHARPYIRIDLGLTGVRLARKGGSRWRNNPTGYHRWNDSGDLQSVEHLGMICEVARRTPKIKQWLPTNELGIVKRYLASGGTIPDNLVIRVSSVMMDDQRRRAWPHTSSVFVDMVPSGAHRCPAPENNHTCGSCRSCWSKDVAHVSYAAH
jgi:hypothetical protein